MFAINWTDPGPVYYNYNQILLDWAVSKSNMLVENKMLYSLVVR